MSYAPVPQVDSQPEPGHARELVHPGSEADDVHGSAINGGSTLQSLRVLSVIGRHNLPMFLDACVRPVACDLSWV